MLKKIIIFLIGCAVGYACWTSFVDQSQKASVTEKVVSQEALDTTISEENGIKELPEDTMKLDSVMSAL